MISSALYPILLLIAVSNAFISNIPEINNLASAGNSKTVGGPGIKTPADLLYSGDHVCDKFSSTIQGSNNTNDFPIDFNLYVANNDKAQENYTVDLYFKNPAHQSLNDFAILNASDSDTVLQQYNPQLISKQPGFGVEFKFNFAKGMLCQFLYQFTVMYQLERQEDHSKTSDKIFLVGSCQENKRYHPEAYNDLVSQGFRCVEYNSGYKYDGGKDWCTEFYPSDQCCKSYQNDELTDRDTCPAGGSSSVGTPTSSVFSASTLKTVSNQSTGQASATASATPGQPAPGQAGPGQSSQFQ